MSIRFITSLSEVPPGAPKRYRNSRGYIRLRWLIAPSEYVEVLEHRLVMGIPEGQVHHINRIKHDNRPENLIVLTAEEHTQLHAREDWESGKYTGVSQRDRERAQRRLEIERRWDRMADLYRSGATTITVGEEFGIDPSNVSRGLRARGVQMRSTGEVRAIPIDGGSVIARYAAGEGATRIARELRVSLARVHRVLSDAGIALRGAGRVRGGL